MCITIKSSIRSLVLFFALLASATLKAQVGIPSMPFTYTENFTSFPGTVAGLPVGWTVAGSYTARGQGNGTSNTGGLWAYGNNPEYALGALCSGTSSSIQYKVSFKNNAAVPVTALNIAYDFEQWRWGGGNTNGFTVTQTGIGAANVSGLSATSVANGGTNGVAATTHKVINLTGLSIAPNAVFTLTWSISDGSGSDNSVAIDNFVLTATTAATVSPVVTVDPVNDTACAATPAAFAITATNATGYQWQEFITSWNNVSNGGVYTGATTAALNISNATGFNNRKYRCIALGASVNDTSASATLVVNNATVITQQAVAASVCAGTDTSFQVLATGTNLTYQWQVNTGAGFTNIANNTIYAGATTNHLQVTNVPFTMNGYLYRCVVTGACLPVQNSTAALLEVRNLPVATLTPAAGFNFCKGDTMLLQANTGAGLTYQWLFNGLPVTAANAATYKDTATGSYTVTVTDVFGCKQTATPITATALPHAANITAAGSTTFCAGDSVLLHANTGAGFTYQWLQSGSVLTGAVNDTLVVNSNGSYRVVVSNSIGCTDTSTAVSIVANAAPPASILPLGTTAFCQGDSVGLDAGFTPGLTYQWTLNNTPIAGAVSATYYATLTGNYSVKVATATTCFSYAADVPVTVHALPAAVLTPATPTAFCAGDSVLLAANTGAGLTYQWFKNGTALTSVTNDTFTTNTAGQYTFLVTDGNGCKHLSDTATVIVHPLPIVTITPAGSHSICQNDSIVFHANAATASSYQWYKNASVLTGSALPELTATTGGSYAVLVTDINNCAATSLPVTLNINPLPVATTSLSGSTTFCQGDSVKMAVPAVTGLTYQWQHNGTNIPFTANAYTAKDSGAYQVVITNTATTCKSISVPVGITVHLLPAAILTATTPLSFCDGDSVVLQASTGAQLSYQWSMNGVSFVHTNDTYAAKVSGDYAVTVTDSNGCYALSPDQHIVVNPNPTNQITYATPLIFCEGGAVVLTAHTGTGITYQWLKNGFPDNVTTYSNIVSTSGEYAVIATNIYNCSLLSGPVLVDVLPVPHPVVTKTGTLLSAGTYMSYQWSRNNQLVVSATSRDYRPDQNGAYSVEVIDSNGCFGESDIVFVNNVGVGTVHAGQSLSVYPNPVQTILYIKSSAMVGAILTDLQGRVMMQETNTDHLDVQQLPAGMYFLRIYDQQGHLLATQKVNKIN